MDWHKVGRKVAAMVLAFTGLVPTLEVRADWPQFRGPDGQGHASDQPVAVVWGVDRNIDWKKAIPGEGWSSPVTADGKVFLTSAVPDLVNGGYDLMVMGLSADSGETLWNVKLFDEESGSPGIHEKNSHASPTPVIEGDRLYVHFGHLGTGCLTTDGTVVWRTQELRYIPLHGAGASPVLYGNAVIFSADGERAPFVAALRKSDGSLLWKRVRDTGAKNKISFCTPLVITIEDRPVLISPGSDEVVGLNPETGKTVWTLSYTGYSVIPRPVFAHGLIFVSTGWEQPTLLAIRANGRGRLNNSSIAWTASRSISKTPSFLVVGEELYVLSDNGILTCFDAKSGGVHYRERLSGDFSASLLFAGGRIYATSESGVTSVVSPGKEFELVAVNDLKERTLASLAVDDGFIFHRTATSLFRIRPSR